MIGERMGDTYTWGRYHVKDIQGPVQIKLTPFPLINELDFKSSEIETKDVYPEL